jgi:hypothetical protein
MPPVRSPSPPVGGWRGCNPTVVIQIAQLMQAARLIDKETPMGRQLLAGWRGIDGDRPDAAAYTRMVAELEPSEIDYQAAFHSLLREDNR